MRGAEFVQSTRAVAADQADVGSLEQTLVRTAAVGIQFRLHGSEVGIHRHQAGGVFGELQRGFRRAHGADGAIADDDAVAVAQYQHQVNVERADILDVLDGDVLEVGVRIGQLQDGNGHGGTP